MLVTVMVPSSSAQILKILCSEMEFDMISVPYHPASNELAERAFKEHMLRTTEGSINAHLSHFLFRNRNTPHTTTGISPAELMYGRRQRILLDLVHPNIAN